MALPNARRRTTPVWRPVERILDAWRIDDEWWRERSIARRYFLLLLDDSAIVSLYQDEGDGCWYRQAY